MPGLPGQRVYFHAQEVAGTIDTSIASRNCKSNAR